jgi:hypothetical protein
MGSDAVLIGVDPHRASNTLAVLDPVTRVVVASKSARDHLTWPHFGRRSA